MLVTLSSAIGVLGQVPNALLLIQPPAEVPGKAAEDGPNSWALAVMYRARIPGCWLQLGSALAGVATGGVN